MIRRPPRSTLFPSRRSSDLRLALMAHAVLGEHVERRAERAHGGRLPRDVGGERVARDVLRSEEHTSELQSLAYLVCRLLLEKKKKTRINNTLRKKTATHA